MAWPDSPPQEQLNAYEAGLSGWTEFTYLRDGSTTANVPSEYLRVDEWGSVLGIKAGYFYPDELEAWLADQAPPEPEPEPEPGEPEPDVGRPTVAQVQVFLGEYNEASPETIAARLLVQKQAVSAYTRGVGFVDGQPNDDLTAVVLSATARDVANPGYLATTVDGPFQRTRSRNSGGWTLMELASLNRYRKRAD